MMNPILESLFARKSTRAFEDRPIGPDEKNAILSAAAQAPSAGNQMLYTILDITDQQLKERLSQTCDNQPFIARAPMVLIFLADCQRWYDAYRYAGCAPRDAGCGDLLLAMADALIAAQNAVTAAESLGIGSCYIGDILENCETHRELLHLADYTVPAAMLVFGYPSAQQTRREKPARFDLSGIVQENAYHPLSATELEAMFRQRHGQGDGDWDYTSYIQAFCKRKYASDFSMEMSRSVREYLGPFLK